MPQMVAPAQPPAATVCVGPIVAHQEAFDEHQSTRTGYRREAQVGRDGAAQAVRPPAVLLILLVWFIVPNTEKVSVDIFFVTVKAPLIVVLIVTAVVGALIMLLLQRRNQRA